MSPIIWELLLIAGVLGFLLFDLYRMKREDRIEKEKESRKQQQQDD